MRLMQGFVTALFYVPFFVSLVHPILGFTATTMMVVWHFRHQPFKRALDQMESLYRPPTPFDPMEIIKDE